MSAPGAGRSLKLASVAMATTDDSALAVLDHGLFESELWNVQRTEAIVGRIRFGAYVVAERVSFPQSQL